MGTIFVLIGSILGLVVAILLFTLFDAGLPVALAVWVLSGPLAALIVVAMALRPAAAPHPTDPQAETV